MSTDQLSSGNAVFSSVGFSSMQSSGVQMKASFTRTGLHRENLQIKQSKNELED